MKSTTMFAAAFLCLATTALPQNSEQPNPFHLQVLNAAKEKSELIVDGSYLDHKTFIQELANGKDMLTATKITPDNTIKGSYDPAKAIIILTSGGFVDGFGYAPSVFVPQKGMCFLRETTNPFPGDPFFDNATIYIPTDGVFITYNNSFERGNVFEAWFGTVRFTCIEQARRYIKTGEFGTCTLKKGNLTSMA